MLKKAYRLSKAALAPIGGDYWLNRLAEWAKSQAGDKPPATDEDGLPIPSPYIICLVAGTPQWRFFLKNGHESAQVFAEAVDRHGGDFQNAGRVLDFGCGCGRVIRHMPKLTDAELYGVDYNRRLVRWCQHNLPGAFSVNRLAPPLGFPDGYFDVLYALSVFTHLQVETQNDWLREFARVIRSGGLALVTLHDEDDPRLANVGFTGEALVSKGVHCHEGKSEGTNFTATFQSRDYARAQLSEYFEVLEITPSQTTPVRQAIAVLRKP